MNILNGYKQTELGIIPEDWEVVLLGSGLRFQTGYPFQSLYFNGDGIGVRLIRNRDLKSDDSITHYSGAIHNEFIVSNEDILIGMDGDFMPCVWDKGIALLNQRVGRLVVKKDWSPRYLYYALQEPLKQKEQGTGATTVKHLSHSDIEKMFMPIPSSNEQRAIAEALSDVDGLIAALDKKIAKKRLLKQGAMQQLLTGKKRLSGYSNGWSKITFGEYVDIYRGGSPRPIENYITNKPNGVNWIKIGDVKPDDKYINKTEERIVPEGVSRSRQVYVGDFILSNSMSFGRPYILNIDGCIHDGWLVIQNYQHTFNRDYLYYLLCSDDIITQYIAMAAGSSVKNLNKEKVASLQLYIPINIYEQQAIATILSDMDKEIANLEARRDKYRLLKSGMMQKLLTGQIRLKDE